MRQRLADLGLQFAKIHTEFFGVNACHAHLAPRIADPPEVQLRIGARRRAERTSRPLHARVDSAGAERTSDGDRLWRRPPAVREVVAYWPALVPRKIVRTRVEVVE